MTPKSLILWLHVICGAGWVGSCLIFLLASMALGEQQQELREFLERVAPRTNRIGIVCSILIPLTGMANFAFATAQHHYQLTTEFNVIVGVKILLLATMVLMLLRASRIHGLDPRELRSEARRLSLAYGVIAGCGAVALILGLWLSGL